MRNLSPKKFTEIYGKLSFIYPVTAVTAAISYFLAMKNDFDMSIMHFERGSVAYTVTCAALGVPAILSIILSVLAGKRLIISDTPRETPITMFAKILTALCAVMLTFSEALAVNFAAVSKFEKISVYLLPFAAVYAVLSIVNKKSIAPLCALAASLAALSVNFTMFSCYFDFSIPLNCPVRDLSTYTNASIMLFLFSEARLASRTSEKNASFYIFANGAAASVALGVSAGALITKFAAPIAGDPNFSLLRLAMYAGIGLLALTRVLSAAKLFEEKEEPAPEAEETQATPADEARE